MKRNGEEGTDGGMGLKGRGKGSEGMKGSWGKGWGGAEVLLPRAATALHVTGAA